MKNNKTAIAPLESSEKYASLYSTCNSLKIKLSNVENKIQETRTNLLRRAGSQHSPQTAERIARLTGEAPSEVSEHITPMAVLVTETNDLRAAISVIESKLACERVVASKAICERAEPEYRRRVAAVCSALIELNARVADYASIINELQGKDIAFVSYLRPMQPHFIDKPNDRNGMLAIYLREAADNKFIDRSIIPPELK